MDAAFTRSSLFSLPDSFEQQERFFSPRYLDSPLIADGIERDISDALLTTRVSPLAYHLRTLLERLLASMNITTAVCDTVSTGTKPGWTISMISPLGIIDLAESVAESRNDTSIPAAVASAQADIVNSILKVDGISSSCSFDLDLQSESYFRKEASLELIINRIVRMRLAGDKSSASGALSSSLSNQFVCSDRYCVLAHKASKTIKVLTYDMLLAATDICRVRGRVLLAAHLFYPQSSIQDRIINQWNWQKAWISLFGNEGFSLAKQTEALNKALLSKISDPDLADQGPYAKMWIKIEEKISKVVNNESLSKEIYLFMREKYEQYTSHADIQTITELFGIQKTIGHPFIYVKRGGKSAAKEALEYQYATDQVVKELRATWCGMFCSGYIAKEHKWPELFFPDRDAPTRLQTWYNSHYLNVQPADFNLDDWDGVRFGKIFDYDEFENYLELVDDKSISFERDVMDAYWNKDIQASTNRRLLLEVLSREGFTYRAVVELVEEDKIPVKWKIVCLSPKEREMKPDARMFALMVFEMRCFFAGSEANLAKHVFPYISAQTMTKDKASISQLFYSVTTPESSPEYRSFFLECDLSRWNLHWRGRTVEPIGADLNDMFGVARCFTAAHKFFEECVIVVRTARERPDGVENMSPPASDLVWYNHQGGFEGIQQKLWSLATYAMMQRALNKLKCSYVLIGQGDNQVVSVRFPPDPAKAELDDVKDTIRATVSALSEGATEVGQDMKAEECLESRTVLTYSKNVWVSGVEYFLSIKFASRMFARTNNEIPTLTAELAGLHAAGLQAAEANVNSMMVYIMVSFLHTLELNRRLIGGGPEFDRVSPQVMRRLRTLSVSDHIKILWWPAALAGLSLSNYSEYLHRGTADPLSESLACLLKGMAVSKFLAPLEVLYTSRSFLNSDADASILLSDPYALPIIDIPAVGSSLQRLVTEFITNSSSNKDVTVLIDEDARSYYDDIETSLLSMTPFYPLIAREILDNSAYGEARRISKMFTATQTVQRASRASGYDGSSEIVLISGEEFAARTSSVLAMSQTASPSRTVHPRDQWEAKELRHAWTQSISVPLGVSSVVPIWSKVIVSRVPTTIQGVKLIANLPEFSLSSRGPMKPYLGARTKLTRSEHGYKILGDSRPADAMRKLQSLSSLPGIGPSLKEMIVSIMQSRGPVDDDISLLAGAVTGGHIHHRYHSRDEERGSFVVGSGNLSTHCTFISDEFTPVSGSVEDYPIMFQEFYTYMLGLLRTIVNSDPSLTGYLELVLVPDIDTLAPLEPLAVDLETTFNVLSPSSLRESRMIYDPKVWNLKLTGAAPIKNLFDPIVPTDDILDYCKLSALRSIFDTSIPASTVAHAIQDGVFSSRRPLDLDLSEVIRIPEDDLILAGAVTIALSVGQRLISEVQHPLGTGRQEIYIRRLCEHAAILILGVLDNPQIGASTSGKLSHQAAYPTYADEANYDKDHLASSLTHQVRRILQGKVSINRYLWVFQSDRGGSLSRMMSSCIGLIATISFYQGFSWADVCTMLGSTSLREAMSIKAEAPRCRAIMVYVEKVLCRMPLRGLPRRMTKELLNNSLITLIAWDIKLAKRLFRSGDPAVTHPSKSGLQLNTSLALASYSPSDDTVLVSEQAKELCRLHPRLRWHIGGAEYPGLPHLSAWMQALSRHRTKKVFVIGVGLGASCAAAFSVGFEEVVGLDLLSVYRIKDIRSGKPPPAVINLRSSSIPTPGSYRWSRAMYQYQDGWANPECRKEVFLEATSGNLFVIDIQPYWDTYDLLKVAKEAPSGTRILFRSFTNVDRMDLLWQQLSWYDSVLDILVYISGGECMCFITCDSAGELFEEPDSRTSFRYSVMAKTVSVPGFRSSIVSKTMISWNIFASLISRSACDPSSFRESQALLLSTIGRQQHSSNYSAWTKDLARMRLLQWVLDEHSDPHYLVSALKEEKTLIERPNEPPLSVVVSPVMKRWWIMFYGCF
ncbi:large protein [Bondarzewia berkeleyi negative-strand RNA virus 1]|uniref:RNA-directed RNA polymerase n=1 Tax=Bondarzewia berkeleyi negative-strand RNA virus 1 TaxID=2768771 RepID=A0AAE7JKU6_9MONO|nr:large protein [Bondarzewia berkeleyi negative-strand RNA virus 1]QNQ73380.1 large protein [Bondarzewia berkeleyi negative-strand RNA virus 1]